MRYTLLGLILMLVISCNSSKKKVPKELSTIQDLVERTGFIHTPWIYKSMDEDYYTGHMPGIGGADYLKYKGIRGQVVGVLPDTTNYFAVVYFDSNYHWMPGIYTFDKSGEKIDSTIICLYRCARIEQRIDTCIERTVIEEDLKISMYNKLVISNDYDDSTTRPVCDELWQRCKIDTTGSFLFTRINKVECNN